MRPVGRGTPGKWREDGRRWYEEIKPAVERANLALQDEVPEQLDDAALARHLAAAIDNVAAGIRVHFDLVAPNVVPVGALIDATARGGIAGADALSLLAGSSPGSAAGVNDLEAVAAAVRAAPVTPRSLDDVRDLGSDVAAALAQWLRRYGSRVLTSYDIDHPTLVELPDLVLRTVLMAAMRADAQDQHGRSEQLLAGLPAHLRREVEELLPEAVYAYGLRDDNASSTLSWPSGLLRRGVLAAADRLVERGRIAAREHVFELHPDELRSVLAGAEAPTSDDLRARAETRRRHLEAPAPRELGPEEPLPELEPLPLPLRRVARAALVTYELMDTAPAGTARGTGIGDTVVRGRARVASSAEQALALLEPGEILVVPFTTPAYNAILPLAAALVVEEGGALSHAALVARELGVPAVIGLPGILGRVPDGCEVEVDPRAGTVRATAAAEM